jgi:hypothetical protein
MSPTVERTARTHPRRRARRQNAALLLIASLVGLWLGTSAPSTSPVVPSAPPAPVTRPQAPAPTPTTTPPAQLTVATAVLSANESARSPWR